MTTTPKTLTFDQAVARALAILRTREPQAVIQDIQAVESRMSGCAASVVEQVRPAAMKNKAANLQQLLKDTASVAAAMLVPKRRAEYERLTADLAELRRELQAANAARA